MTVKMDRSRISSTTFQHIQFIRDLQFLRCFHEEIPKPEVWNHASVPDPDDRAFSKLSLGIVFLNIRNIPCNADFHREPHIRLNDPRACPGPSKTHFFLDSADPIHCVGMFLPTEALDHLNEEGTSDPIVECLGQISFASTQDGERTDRNDGIPRTYAEFFDLGR